MFICILAKTTMPPLKTIPFRTAVIACLLMAIASHLSLAQSDSGTALSRSDLQLAKKSIAEAFRATHNGWSSDEVILQDDLNEAFIESYRELTIGTKVLHDLPSSKVNWMLINLRKAGKLKSKTTKRKKVDLSKVRHVAEIVTRSMVDKHQCSIDRLICDSELRKEFDQNAKSFDNSIDLYSVRKAAFQLRKARKLKPELISRIADWGRKIECHEVDAILKTPELLSDHPGIYIFRDSTGYLYIGQTDNLRERLESHLDESHNLSLAKYLNSSSGESITIEVHDFDPDSRAAEVRVRRAYESELIASRKPRFNLQP